jgi:competence ComEA-like helix-hairpin-helix protein
MSKKEYLSFTRKERSGIITLVVIILVVAIVPKYLFPEKKLVAKTGEPQQENTVYQPAGDSNQQKYVRYPHAPPKSFHRAMVTRQRPLHPIDINSADTTAFIALPGIGSKLASRIVLFREKLGGFYTVDQIGEVYGLRDSVFQKIRPALRCDRSGIKMISINSAAKEELKAHPYIRWKLANVLVQYRTMHGPFSSLDDLKKIENLDSSALARMAPYLRFDP